MTVVVLSTTGATALSELIWVWMASTSRMSNGLGVAPLPPGLIICPGMSMRRLLPRLAI